MRPQLINDWELKLKSYSVIMGSSDVRMLSRCNGMKRNGSIGEVELSGPRSLIIFEAWLGKGSFDVLEYVQKTLIARRMRPLGVYVLRS